MADQPKKLSEILGSKKGVDFEFVGLQMDETRDGLPIVRLILKDNLPVVYGRQIVDPVSQDRVRVEANDVEMVSIGKDTLDIIDKMESDGKSPFTWTREGESGRFKTDELRLDVAGQTLEVWVTKDGFAAFGAKRRNEQRQAQRSSLVARLRANKTEKEFKDTNLENSNPAGEDKKGTENKKPEAVSEKKS